MQPCRRAGELPTLLECAALLQLGAVGRSRGRGGQAQRPLGAQVDWRVGTRAGRSGSARGGGDARVARPARQAAGTMRQTRKTVSSEPRGQKRPGASKAPAAAASAPGASRARRPTGQAGGGSRAAARQPSAKQRPRQLSPLAQEAGPGEPPPELALLPPPQPATPTSSVATLDLGDQRERWETFQKRQRLTFEGAAKLLLDTL